MENIPVNPAKVPRPYPMGKSPLGANTPPPPPAALRTPPMPKAKSHMPPTAMPSIPYEPTPAPRLRDDVFPPYHRAPQDYPKAYQKDYQKDYPKDYQKDYQNNYQNNYRTDYQADYDTGEMPQTGMLANTYVPYQKPGKQYSQKEALKKGTLYPGLDLPYKNYVATRDVAVTPLTELMAVDFAIGELGLYLDTHPNDTEALKMYDTYVKTYLEGKEAYERQYGPIDKTTVMEGKYSWLKSPWPWEAQ